MKNHPSITRSLVIVRSLCLLCVALAAGCSTVSTQPSAAIPSVVPTPTVDIEHARHVLEMGGELSYDAVIALRQEMVGEHPDATKYGDDEMGRYNNDYAAYIERQQAF